MTKDQTKDQTSETFDEFKKEVACSAAKKIYRILEKQKEKKERIVNGRKEEGKEITKMLYFKSKDGTLHPFTLKINSLVPEVELEFVQTDKDVLLPNVEISEFINKEVLQNAVSSNLKVTLIFRRTQRVIDALMREAEL